MKPERIFSYTIFLIISFQSLQGQRSLFNDYVDLTASEICLTGELYTPDFIIDGTTYFNSEWLPGDIYLSNGEVVRNKLIKYNGLIDELLWKEPKSGSIIKLDKEAIMQFHFLNLNRDSTIYFRKTKIKKNVLADSSEVFEQVLYEGSLSLFVLHAYKTAGTELIRKNGVLFEKNVYTEEPTYFLRLRNNKAVGFNNLNRKNLYTFLPDKKDQIKRFFKQIKQTKIQTYPDIIMLMKFLNSIVNQ